MKNLKPIDLGNGVFLFKNVLDDAEKTYKFILDSKTNDDPYFGKDIWYDWQPWGNYAKAYPVQDHSYKTSDSEGAKLQRECIDIFFNVLQEYKDNWDHTKFCEKYGFPVDYPTSLEEVENRIINGDKRFNMADLVLFETNKNVEKDWQMSIHQDTVPHYGVVQNHMFNFNIYINDDYEGGSIIFFKHENVEKVPYVDKHTGETKEAWLVEDYFDYKMHAGDGMIFPVDFYHGVSPINQGASKFYIRQFMSYITEEQFDADKYQFLKTGTEEQWSEFLASKKKEAYSKRVNPVIFNSIDEIELSPFEEVRKNQVACVIKTNKDISGIR
jgi:hypothetical protein